MARVLYVSYDGVLEPLGESQVLSVLEGLAPRHRVWLISYEKGADARDVARLDEANERMKRAGISWTRLTYHRRPTVLATAMDLLIGLWNCWRIVETQRIEIIHARSYVPGLLALVMKNMRKRTSFIFDMRGFWPNEKVMAGEWRNGTLLHTMATRCERRLLLGADVIVSLTHAGVDHMRRMPFLHVKPPRFEVIPTCVDTRMFQMGPGTGRPFTLGYVGSVGGRYRFDAVLDCFKQLRASRPDARLRIVSLGDREAIRNEIRLRGIPESSVELTREDRPGVARALGSVDAGILFYRTGLSSTLGTAPTRLGEFLAAGVPCLTNAGIGDASALMEREGIGIVLGDVDDARQRQQAVEALAQLAAQPGIRQRCADVAERTFSLERTVRSYDHLYTELCMNEVSPVRPHQELEALHV